MQFTNNLSTVYDPEVGSGGFIWTGRRLQHLQQHMPNLFPNDVAPIHAFLRRGMPKEGTTLHHDYAYVRNVAYNVQYLEYLSKLIDANLEGAENLHFTVTTLTYKTFVVTYHEQRVATALRDAFERGNGRYACFVAEDDKRQIAGVLLAVLERQIFSELLTASVMHYDVLPEKRMGGYGVRLLKAFESWAANRKVAEIAFGINSGAETETVGRFARKMGFEKVGENFVKRIQ